MMAKTTGNAPYIVSVDDHLVEPASLWESRLPSRLRERGPRAIDRGEGIIWEVEDQRIPLTAVAASAGKPLESRIEVPAHWDEIRPGCYDPVERVKDMDEDGIIASLCFPSIPGFGGTVFNKLQDRELGLACIQAYNDFQIEEWAGSAPGRLFAMVLLPYWDADLAVRELNRTAARGAVAVAFTENPSRQGFPSIHDKDRYWDPVFAAAQDADVPLCMHFGSSSWTMSTAPDAPRIVGTVAAPLNSQLAFIDWILSGVFHRFPRLQVVFSESYIGWIPFVLEHCDRHWSNHFNWATDRSVLPRRPSEYFRDNISVCLVYDLFGARQIEEIGVDKVLAEADYPHPDSQWPNTRKVLEEHLQHLTPEDRYKVLRTNAERLFHLDLAPVE
jgi:predicted TIM-barrel fold metal-dependent hydrolase